MDREQRLRKQIADRQKQWGSVQQKLSKLREDKTFETRSDEKMRLEYQIKELTIEQEQIEQKLEKLEEQLFQPNLESPPTSENKGEQGIISSLIPYYKTKHRLVGRDDLISELKQQLFAGNNLVLHGLPGVGKTALAVELAYDAQVRQHFSDGILWAPLGEHADPFHILGEWLSTLGMKTELVDKEARKNAVHRFIRKQQRILVIIDDAWRIEDIQYFKFDIPNSSSLLTTRQTEIALDFTNEEEIIQVKELSETNGLTLLHNLAPQVVDAEPKEAKQIVQDVAGLPLALTLIGRYLKKEAYTQKPQRVKRALEKLREVEERLKLQQFLPLKGVSTSIYATIEISYENLDEATKHMLRILAVFPPKPQTFSEKAAMFISDESAETLDALTDASLLEGVGPDRYTLHKIISVYATSKLSELPNEKTQTESKHSTYYAEFVKQRERQLISENPRKARQEFEKELSNIRLMWERVVEQRQKEIIQKASNGLYNFYLIRGSYRDGEKAFDLAVKAFDKYVEEISPELMAKILLFQGEFSHELCHYPKAESLYKRSLEICEEVFGREHPDVATSLNDLAMLHLSLEKYEEAEPLFQRALEIRKKLFGSGHRDVAKSLNNLASLYYHQGNYKEAEYLYQQSLEIREKILGLEHPDRADSLNNIAQLYSSQGKHPEAESYFKQALEIWENVFGPEHPNVATVRHNLGDLYYSQGKHEEAEKFYQQALEIRQKNLDSEHPNVAISLRNLAVLFSFRGKYEIAESFFKQAFTICEKSFGLNHRKTLEMKKYLKDLNEKIKKTRILSIAIGMSRQTSFDWHKTGMLSLPKQQHSIRDVQS